MNETFIEQAISHLKSNIYKYVHHRALLQNTGEPILDEHQLFFMLLPQLNGDAVHSEYEMNITTVGIVHASLMEHDKILAHDAVSKEQQLTVLSGDYYSGRYYELLALTGNIALISKLSQGIVARCESEIAVYEDQLTSVAQWIAGLTVIESKLITQFYVASAHTAYNEIAEQTLTILRVQRELKAIQHHQPTLFGQAMLKIDSNIEQTLNTYLKDAQQALTQTLATSNLNKSLQQYVLEMAAVHTA